MTNKRISNRITRKITGAVLTLALAASAVGVNPVVPTVTESEAYSADEAISDQALLDNSYVPDSSLLNFYKIIANIQKKGEATSITGMNAGQIISAYGSNSDYTGNVTVAHLTEFEGDLDFTGLAISDISGVGLARSASSIDISGATGVGSITKIANDEFALCTNAEKIILPGSVTEIGNRAFNKCSKLTTLGIGSASNNLIDLSKVKKIGNEAFASCSSVENVNLGAYDANNELVIGDQAFTSCSSLKSIEIPIKTAKNLGIGAFQSCSNLEEVGLYNDLTYINNSLFYGVGEKTLGGTKFYIIGDNTKDYSVLPSNITYIGEYAFQHAGIYKMDLSGCTKLTSIKVYGMAGADFVDTFSDGQGLILPDSLETLEELAFNAAYDPYLKLPDKCVNLARAAFMDSLIPKIDIPAGVKVFNKDLFRGSYITDELNIPSNSQLTEIKDYAFAECHTLESTKFLKDLKNLTTIGDYAFSACSYAIKSVNDVYGEQMYVSTGLKDVVLPNSVMTIGKECFSENYWLNSVNLGSGVTVVPEKAFYNKNQKGSRLRTVVLSNKLTDIEAYAFGNQEKLSTIGTTDGSSESVKEGVANFSGNLTKIGEHAFDGCGSSLGMNVSGAFICVEEDGISTEPYSGAIDVLAYELGEKDPKKLYIDPSSMIEMTGISYETVPENYKMLFVEAVHFNYDESMIKTKKENGDISTKMYDLYPGFEDKDVLYGNQSVTMSSAILGNSGSESAWFAPTKEMFPEKKATIKSFKNMAVYGLKDVNLPNSMVGDVLGAYAFNKCVNLNNVVLSKNITKINANTFANCGSEYVNFENSSNELYDYFGLKTFTIPEELDTIGDNAFNSCYNLRMKVSGGSSFGSKLKTIGKSAFTKCYSLSEIAFPSTLESIGESAFENASVLDDKTYKVMRTDGTEYSYKRTFEKYGVIEPKTGLNSVDFKAASKLTTLGKNAFKSTNITDVTFAKSPIVDIPTGLFEQCTQLRNVAFHDKTESIADKVLKDNIYLNSVTLPAQTTIKQNSICGYFNSSASLTTNNGTGGNTVSIPIGGTKVLPINLLNKDTANSNVTISVVDGGQEFVLLKKENGEVKTDNQNTFGISAEYDETTNPYQIKLNGLGYTTKDLTVKVEAGVAFPIAESSSNWIQSVALTYNVSVTDIGTEEVDISAADDTYVKRRPDMYSETNTSKDLYFSIKDTNAVKLTAAILPKETTSDVEWSSDNTRVAIVSDAEYTKGSGVSTANVKITGMGDTTITCKSGLVTDTVKVHGVVPLASSGISAKSSGEFLPAELTKGREYSLVVGDSDKVTTSLDYGTTDYSESELSVYGEKIKYTSSNPDVLSVSADGTVKAVSEGKAQLIIVGQTGAVKNTYTINVTGQANYTVAGVKINSTVEKLGVGDSIQLSAVVSPTKAVQTVKWSVTSGSSYATVDESTGIVKAIAPGTVKIKATSTENSSVYDVYSIKIDNPVKLLKFEHGTQLSINVNKSYTFSVQEDSTRTSSDTSRSYVYITPKHTDKLEWTSSNENIVKISSSGSSSAYIKTLKEGEAVLTVKASSGMSASIVVKVYAEGVDVSNMDKISDLSSDASNNNNGTVDNPSGSKSSKVKVGKVKIKKAKNVKKKAIKLKWKKVSGAKGYQISYSLKKKPAKGKKKTTKKLSFKIKKLKKKKKYNVWVRAFKISNGKKVYGAWSKKKRVKIKK
ncbi:MAG: leucine-rich repeat protein [Eubacterium sp.]|nr:leucine-rich repeat protein [Eubacterium sp.]